jgi:hypothetical protein
MVGGMPHLAPAELAARPRIAPAERAARPRIAGLEGQATVELLALLPVLLALVLAAWQAVLAGHATWAVTSAARAAARAHAVGADPRGSARAHLPAALEPDLRMTTTSAGQVRVSVRIPPLPGLPSPGRATATAHFEPQS